VPWNPAAWWQLRRLRLAMEVDCDSRVLARRADVRAYGTLLLEVGRRTSGARLVGAAAFSEPRSFLERRIRIMTSPHVRFPWLRAGGFGAVALALVAVACETPGPVGTAPAPSSVEVTPMRMEARSDRVALRSPGGISRSVIRSAVELHYPEVLRAAASDTTTLMFVIDPQGDIARHSRLQTRRKSPMPQGTEEVDARLGEAAGIPRTRMDAATYDAVTFQPGQMGPGLVEVVWVRELSDTQAASADTEPAQRRTPGGVRTGAPNEPETLITAEEARGFVSRYMPQVAERGTTAEFVWFMADADGRIVGHGDSDHSQALNARSPDSYANVQVFSSDVIDVNGHPVSVIYVRLKA
jgi:hypothetical protein